MTAILWSWAVAAAVVIVLAVVLGTLVKLKPGPFGILIDSRGRFSLNHLQLVIWSVVVISLIAGVFFGRLIEGVDDPLGFLIPDRVLGLLGISVGAAVTVGAVKATKSATSAQRAGALAAAGVPGGGDAAAAAVAGGAVPPAAAAMPLEPTLATYAMTQIPPFFGQVFLVEEGELADEVVDVTKFQSFLITIVLVVAYVAVAIDAIVEAKTAVAVTALPDISGTFLVLLGISYAGYAGGKLPTPPGKPLRAAG